MSGRNDMNGEYVDAPYHFGPDRANGPSTREPHIDNVKMING